jgi:hypothetical protein
MDHPKNETVEQMRLHLVFMQEAVRRSLLSRRDLHILQSNVIALSAAIEKEYRRMLILHRGRVQTTTGMQPVCTAASMRNAADEVSDDADDILNEFDVNERTLVDLDPQ